jgi:predicted TPR repeat methyltransferase
VIAEAHNNRGLVLERLGRQREAVEGFDRAIALQPGFCDAHVNRGNALDDPDQAMAAYDKALAMRPGLAEALLGRGNVLYKLDRYDEALAQYNEALARKPELANAWLGRGNANCKLKRLDEGIADYEKALLTLQPDLPAAWLGRGNALCDLKRHDEALAAYDQALALAPNLSDAWFGRGNVFFDLKRWDDALAAYDKALALNPQSHDAWFGRAHVLKLLKRGQDAIAAYREARRFGGDVEVIDYCLAGLGEAPSPIAPPEQYVVSLFDAYAERFDHDLVGNLKYSIPVSLAEAIKRFVPAGALDILDLGCGTGLMGAPLRELAKTLTGVDLSPNMLEKARERGIYDHLVVGDLVKFVQEQDRVFDLAVAADVFIYVGDLSRVFAALRRVLRHGGRLCFSIEAAATGDFVLRNSLRYAHSIDYVRTLAGQYEFIVEAIEPAVVRREYAADIPGYNAILRLSRG